MTSLLVNLFPSVSWDSLDKSLDKESKFILNDLTVNLVIYDLTTVKLDLNRKSDVLNSSQYNSMDSFDYSTEHDDELLLENYLTNDFKEFTNKKISCYDFSLIEINLLIELVSNENLISLDRNSITAQCLNFSILKIHSMERNFTELDVQRKDELKNVILKLFLISLNNFFISFKNICDCIDSEMMISKLFDVLEYELTTTTADDLFCDLKLENCFSIFYSILIFLNNIFLKNFMEIENFQNLFLIFIKKCDCELNLFLKKLKIHNNSKKKVNKILKILIKITSDFKKTSDESDFLNLRKRKKCKQNCGFKVHSIHHEISKDYKLDYKVCFMENLLINLLKNLKIDEKKVIFHFFRKNGLCCCNFEQKSLPSILEMFENIEMQKIGLNFIKNNILTIFDTSCCDFCDLRRKSDDFQEKFIEFYKILLKKLKGNLYYISLLKHIGKIAAVLPYNYSQRILFDLIIKIFHDEKNKIENESILKCCLNIFTFYLKDIQLIEEFFNEEMLFDLNNLLKIPELAQDVLSILKIGIICREEITEMIIQSTVKITKNLIILFKDFNQLFELKSTRDQQDSIEFLPITNLIKLSAIYWNSINQLIRISSKFKNQFKNEFDKHFDDTTLINTVYNSLSCLLNLNRKKNFDLSNSIDFCILTKNDLFEDTTKTIESLTDECYRKGIFDIDYDINFNKMIFFDSIIELDENLILTHQDVFNSNNNIQNNLELRLIYNTKAHRKLIKINSICDENNLIESVQVNNSKNVINRNIISSVFDTLASELSFITNSVTKLFSQQQQGREGVFLNDFINYSIEDVLQLKTMENRKMLSKIFETMLGVVSQFYTSNRMGEFLIFFVSF